VAHHAVGPVALTLERIAQRHEEIAKSIPERFTILDDLPRRSWNIALRTLVDKGGVGTFRLRFSRGRIYATINIEECIDGLVRSEYIIKAKTAKGGLSKVGSGYIMGDKNPVPTVVVEADNAHSRYKVEDIATASSVKMNPFNDQWCAFSGKWAGSAGIGKAQVSGMARILENNEVEILDVHNPREFDNAPLFVVNIITLKGSMRMMLTNGEEWIAVNYKTMRVSRGKRYTEEMLRMGLVDKFIINKAIELYFGG